MCVSCGTWPDPQVYLSFSMGKKWNLNLESLPAAWEGCVQNIALHSLSGWTCWPWETSAYYRCWSCYISPPFCKFHLLTLFHTGPFVLCPSWLFPVHEVCSGWGLWAPTSSSWHCDDLGHLLLCRMFTSDWYLDLTTKHYQLFFLHLLKWPQHFFFLFFC